jgi:hypothetical protein
MRYPDILNNHVWKKLRLADATVENMSTISSNIYGGIVRFRTEVINLAI